MITLRDYQRESVDAQLAYWEGGGEHSLVVLPTGAGKSLVAAELIRILYQKHGARVLLASHVSELITQNAAALTKLWPEAPLGIYHSGLGKRDGAAPIVFAGIHSIFRTPEVLGEREVLLIDEAHLLSHKDSGMYRALIKRLQIKVPGMRVCGLTATAYRLSTGRLDEDYGGHKALFSDIVYEVPVLRLIKDGWLCPILPYVSPQRIDVTGVKVSAGDYNQKDLQAAVDKDDSNARVVEEIIRAGRDRVMWLVFASGVDHAKHLTALLQEREIEAACIHGDTPEEERQKALGRARAGKLRALVGMNTLTVGIDIPSVDLIGCVRPTKSKGLWTQMLGRSMRISPETGKQNAILLDFTSNSLTFGPIDMLDGSKAPKGKGELPMRECPDCHFVHHISLMNCPQCNHQYPAPEVKYTSQSRTAALLSTQSEPEWVDVESVVFREHRKEGSPPSFRIDYCTSFATYSHWLAIDSEKARSMAQGFWKRHSFSGTPPETVQEALMRTSDLRVPGRIQVMREGKFNRVIHWDYTIPAGRVIPTTRELPSSKRRMFGPYQKIGARA